MKWSLPIILITLLFICLFGNGCARKAKPVRPVKPAGQNLDTVTKDSGTLHGGYTFYLQGKPVWAADVDEGQARFEGSRKIFTLQRVHCRMFKAGTAQIQVTADSGTTIVDGNTINSTLTGHVLAEDLRQKQQLRTEKLVWNNIENKINVGPFTFDAKDMHMSADKGSFADDLLSVDSSGHFRMETSRKIR